MLGAQPLVRFNFLTLMMDFINFIESLLSFQVFIISFLSIQSKYKFVNKFVIKVTGCLSVLLKKTDMVLLYNKAYHRSWDKTLERERVK